MYTLCNIMHFTCTLSAREYSSIERDSHMGYATERQAPQVIVIGLDLG